MKFSTVKFDVGLISSPTAPESVWDVGRIAGCGVGVGVGAGTGTGVTALDGADAAPDPLALRATTVKVYGVPAVRPLITQEVDAVVHVPPGDPVTV